MDSYNLIVDEDPINLTVEDPNNLTVEKQFFNKHCELIELQSEVKKKRMEQNSLVQKRNEAERQLSRHILLDWLVRHSTLSLNHNSDRSRSDANELEKEIEDITIQIKKFE